MKQLIIVRRDLEMSPGKMAVQVSHASMAFLTNAMRNPAGLVHDDTSRKYHLLVDIECDIYDEWVKGIFTKIVCRAKNRNDLLKVVDVATSLCLTEDKDFFLIKDNCLTELEPEEVDENGVGRVLTCIGFKPLDDDTCKQLSKKYQLY